METTVLGEARGPYPWEVADRPRPPGDIALGVVVVVLVVAFAAMCWWQVTRALGGNTLSWAYVFEWPLFAAYLVYMWRRLSRQRALDHDEAGAARVADDASPPEDPLGEEDEELAAYNRYLASLEESGRRKRW